MTRSKAFAFVLVTIIILAGCDPTAKARIDCPPGTESVKVAIQDGIQMYCHRIGGRTLEGPIVEWYNNGQVKSVGYLTNGKMEGIRVWWHENGKDKELTQYKNDKFEGHSETWYENGQKQGDGKFRNGKMEGLWNFWYENGQKNIKGSFKDGKQEGFFTIWHENGQKMEEGEYKDGKKEGHWTFWHENGQKKAEGEHKDGKREGLRTYWYKNGQKKDKGNFKNGEKEGLWTTWDENGDKINEGFWKNESSPKDFTKSFVKDVPMIEDEEEEEDGLEAIPQIAANKSTSSKQALGLKKGTFFIQHLAGVNFREGPSIDSKIKSELIPGTQVKVIASEESKSDPGSYYYSVKVKGEIGYVYAGDSDDWLAEKYSPPVKKFVGEYYYLSSSTGANLREGPGANFPIKEKLNKGVRLKVLDKERSKTDSSYYYYEIKTDSNTQGWIYAGDYDEWLLESSPL